MSPEEFKQDVHRLAREIGVGIKEIHLRKMKRKWASCSSKGRLTFDPILLEEPEEIRLKTVVHELLHIRYPNHGKMFELMLRRYVDKGQSTMESHMSIIRSE